LHGLPRGGEEGEWGGRRTLSFVHRACRFIGQGHHPARGRVHSDNSSRSSPCLAPAFFSLPRSPLSAVCAAASSQCLCAVCWRGCVVGESGHVIAAHQSFARLAGADCCIPCRTTGSRGEISKEQQEGKDATNRWRTVTKYETIAASRSCLFRQSEVELMAVRALDRITSNQSSNAPKIASSATTFWPYGRILYPYLVQLILPETGCVESCVTENK